VKLLLAAAAAVLAGLGAGLVATAAPAAACPNGTVPTDFPGVCVSGGSGGSAAVPADTSGGGAVIGAAPGQLPSVDGVPCTPQKIGTCIGLSESQG